MLFIPTLAFLCKNLDYKPQSINHAVSGAYAGFLRGGCPTLIFVEIWIYMPRSGMSRAAKLRAFSKGVWGHAPPRKFLKMVPFMVKNPLKKL